MRHRRAAGIGVAAAALLALAFLAVDRRPEPPAPAVPRHAARRPRDSQVVRETLADVERLRRIREDRRVSMGGAGDPAAQAVLERLRARKDETLHYLEELAISRRESPPLRVDLLNVIASDRSEETRLFLSSRVADAGDVEAVRIAALEALMDYKDAATFDVFRGAYLDPSPFQGRYHLCRALGESGRAEAVPLLRDALAPAQPLDLRCHAAEGLGGFVEDPDVRTELRRLAGSDPERRVRQGALRALGRCRARETDTFLRGLADRSDLDPETRELVAALLKDRERRP